MQLSETGDIAWKERDYRSMTRIGSQMAPLDPFSWESVSKETASLCSQQLEMCFDPSLLAPICPTFIYLEI